MTASDNENEPLYCGTNLKMSAWPEQMLTQIPKTFAAKIVFYFRISTLMIGLEHFFYFLGVDQKTLTVSLEFIPRS